jgi:PAS domain S-box-containing protein
MVVAHIPPETPVSRTTIAPNEEARIAALHSLSLLDTPPEERFDRITRLASQLFGIPMSVMSLVDRDVQFFKSRQNVPFPTIPRAGSFCSYALLQDETFVVEDAGADPRFQHHDLVCGPAAIRFYAGHPISTHDGQKIGTLCVLDQKPRRFSDQQRRQLADLARILEGELQGVQLAELQRALTVAQEELRKFFSLSLDMLCTSNIEGYFKKLNPAWEATLGWTLNDLTGRPYVEFVHPEDRERTLSEVQLLAKGNITVAFENRYRCKDGSYRHLLWSAVADQSTGLVYSVARDISALRAAEDELRRSRARAEDASHAKSRFLTNISQEFRTPLNSVLGFTSVLLEEGSELSERQRSFVERIQTNGRDLLFLVNDILDLAQIEAGHTDLEHAPVDLAELVRAVLDRLGPQAKQKGLELRSELAEPLAPLVTDPRRLKQVLVNIVGNAVKFTDSGHITVRVVADATSGRPERIEVEDTGVGISYEQQDRIFVAFHQGDDGLARRYAGTGLGLTISRSLCELLGHRMQLWSRVGLGTTFSIYFVPPARDAS